MDQPDRGAGEASEREDALLRATACLRALWHSVRHDVNGNGKTDLSQDGGGFSNNPKASIFNLGKPAVEKAAVPVGSAPVSIAIVLQYL